MQRQPLEVLSPTRHTHGAHLQWVLATVNAISCDISICIVWFGSFYVVGIKV